MNGAGIDGALLADLKRDEGFRGRPYRDGEGFLTIGYGTLIEEGITEAEAATLLASRLADIVAELERRENVLAWHRYAATADIGGRRRNVTLTVRERPDGSFHYSLHREAESAGGGSEGPRRNETQGHEANRPYESAPGAGENIDQTPPEVK